MLFMAGQSSRTSCYRYFCIMIKPPKTPKRVVLTRVLLKPDNLVWLAVMLMLFTFFRVLYYL